MKYFFSLCGLIITIGWLCYYTATRASSDRCGFNDADQLRCRFGCKHDHRIRWKLDRWSSEQHGRRERLTGGGRRVLQLPQLRRPEFDDLQWPRTA